MNGDAVANHSEIDGSGKWVVQVYQEKNLSRRDFDSMTEASAWAHKFAQDVNIQAGSDFVDLKFSDILDRYGKEESPKRVAYKKQLTKFNYFKNSTDNSSGSKKYSLVDVPLRDLSRFDFVRFRDQRMGEVASGTFIQDWSLFHRAVKVATYEWGWLHRDPMQGIRIPPHPANRMRRLSDSEIDRISNEILAHEVRIESEGLHVRALIIFHLALETALRKSELFAIKRQEVFLEAGYLKVTGEEPNARKSRSAIREVPLTDYAKRLIRAALDWNWSAAYVFGLEERGFSQIFRGACHRAGLRELHFHDTRHEAISRLARHYRSIDLATIVGHRNVQELMTYYKPSISHLVEVLSRAERFGYSERDN